MIQLDWERDSNKVSISDYFSKLQKWADDDDTFTIAISKEFWKYMQEHGVNAKVVYLYEIVDGRIYVEVSKIEDK